MSSTNNLGSWIVRPVIATPSLILFVSLWATMLLSLVVLGTGTIFYELITNPSTFSNATWGIFDTLGS